MTRKKKELTYLQETMIALRDKLPKGWNKIIRKRTVTEERPVGYSEAMIYRVMRGDREANSEVIVSACVVLANETKARKAKLKIDIAEASK